MANEYFKVRRETARLVKSCWHIGDMHVVQITVVTGHNCFVVCGDLLLVGGDEILKDIDVVVEVLVSLIGEFFSTLARYKVINQRQGSSIICMIRILICQIS